MDGTRRRLPVSIKGQMGKLSAQPYATRCVLLLSLIVTAWLVWATSIGPRIGRLPLDLLLGQSLRQLFLDWASGAAIALCVYLTVLWTAQGRILHPRQAVAVGVWFPMAIILMSALSPIAIAAGAVIVFSTTRLMSARLDAHRGSGRC